MKALLLILCLVAGFGPAHADTSRIVVAGDSVLAWNDGGVGRELARLTGAEVESVAVSGAWIGFHRLGGPLMRLSISGQVPDAPAGWVVVNGGANDLSVLCRCRSCDAVRDRLISKSGTAGALPWTWRSLHERTGARVVILGYYQKMYAPTGCVTALAAIDARAARFAARHDWATFVDADAVMTPARLAADRVHPSPEGSKAIAGLIAAAMAR